MKLGTIVYEEKIYNLDYMETDEINELLKKVENNRKEKFTEYKNIIDNIIKNNS